MIGVEEPCCYGNNRQLAIRVNSADEDIENVLALVSFAVTTVRSLTIDVATKTEIFFDHSRFVLAACNPLPSHSNKGSLLEQQNCALKSRFNTRSLRQWLGVTLSVGVD